MLFAASETDVPVSIIGVSQVPVPETICTAPMFST